MCDHSCEHVSVGEASADLVLVGGSLRVCKCWLLARMVYVHHGELNGCWFGVTTMTPGSLGYSWGTTAV